MQSESLLEDPELHLLEPARVCGDLVPPLLDGVHFELDVVDGFAFSDFLEVEGLGLAHHLDGLVVVLVLAQEGFLELLGARFLLRDAPVQAERFGEVADGEEAAHVVDGSDEALEVLEALGELDELGGDVLELEVELELVDELVFSLFLDLGEF